MATRKKPAPDEPVRLNLGSGEVPLEGYVNLDAKTDDQIYPLKAYADGSVDEVRASHVLEHFPHGAVVNVVREWVRVLKPGGVLKIAVPDLETIARLYLAGENAPIQGYLMGGQVDQYDFHRAVFDAEALEEVLRACGLSRIRRWVSDAKDCAALPVSLNLQGEKLDLPVPKIHAVMSMPRLCFTDNFFSAFEALMPHKIPLRKHTGAFWGQCLDRAMNEAIAEGAEWLLTIDYDSVYSKDDIAKMIRVVQEYPEVTALAPFQSSRTKPFPLLTIKGHDGSNVAHVERRQFDGDIYPITTAHFGCTLLKVEALQKLPKPWFLGVPDKDGTWGDGRLDDDIYFWKKWHECGNTLHLACRVAIGHAELQITWPGANLEPVIQHPAEWNKKGKPADVWT